MAPGLWLDNWPVPPVYLEAGLGFHFATLAPIGLLHGSNVFMTFAWYGYLKWPSSALWIAVMISWGIAFFEYWLAVPANRIGEAVYSPSELKTIQEVISLSVFAVFTVFILERN